MPQNCQYLAYQSRRSGVAAATICCCYSLSIPQQHTAMQANNVPHSELKQKQNAATLSMPLQCSSDKCVQIYELAKVHKCVWACCTHFLGHARACGCAHNHANRPTAICRQCGSAVLLLLLVARIAFERCFTTNFGRLPQVNALKCIKSI